MCAGFKNTIDLSYVCIVQTNFSILNSSSINRTRSKTIIESCSSNTCTCICIISNNKSLDSISILDFTLNVDLSQSSNESCIIIICTQTTNSQFTRVGIKGKLIRSKNFMRSVIANKNISFLIKWKESFIRIEISTVFV